MASHEEPPAVGDDPATAAAGSPDAALTAAGQSQTERSASSRLLWLATGVALAHLALIVVDPGPPLVQLAGFELAVFLVVGLLDVLSDPGRRLFRPVVLASVFAGLVGATWLALTVWSPGVTAAAGGLVVSLLAYALHRYQLVTLDRVEATDER